MMTTIEKKDGSMPHTESRQLSPDDQKFISKLLLMIGMNSGNKPQTLRDIYGRTDWGCSIFDPTRMGSIVADLVKQGKLPLIKNGRNSTNHTLYCINRQASETQHKSTSKE